MLLRRQATQALLHRLLPASAAAACPATAAAAAALSLAAARSAATFSSASAAGSAPGPSESAPEGANRTVDAETGLPLSAAPPRELRDEVEEIVMYQLEELLSAKTGVAADPEIRKAAEETLEVLTVCNSCSQELDEAGEWESLLSSAGLINSPADYAGQGEAGSGQSNTVPPAAGSGASGGRD